jgi:drug/metabolite transporter (DMT)-like permease
MDAIGLALVSAALFGALPVAVRFAFRRPLPASVASLYMHTVAACVLLVAAAIQGGASAAGLLPFALAGILAPGLSQLFITVGIREAGSSRSSVAFGVAPLFAIVIAVTVFGEEPGTGVLAGAFLIVGGGIALAGERDRPAYFRRIGIAYALVGAALFATRDNLLRHFSLETDVPSMTAGATTLVSGMAVTALFVALRRHPVVSSPAIAARWILPGAIGGISYVALVEAFYRGPVSVVAPIVGTESLWGVGFSALFLHRAEQVGARLLLGAVLVVAGGVLIGVYR